MLPEAAARRKGNGHLAVCISGPVTRRGNWKKTRKLRVMTNMYFIAPGAQAYYPGIRSSFTSSYNLNPLQPQQVSSDTLHPALVEVHRNLRTWAHTPLPWQPDLQSLGVKGYCFL